MDNSGIIRLPYAREKLETLGYSKGELCVEVLARRRAIRSQRDTVGLARRWENDFPVWMLLEDLEVPLSPLPPDKVEELARKYYRYRCITQNYGPAVSREDFPDRDVDEMSHQQLLDMLIHYQLGIKQHYDTMLVVPSIDAERALYNLLPEKRTANFYISVSEEDYVRACLRGHSKFGKKLVAAAVLQP